jgi:hypothetical protein
MTPASLNVTIQQNSVGSSNNAIAITSVGALPADNLATVITGVGTNLATAITGVGTTGY